MVRFCIYFKVNRISKKQTNKQNCMQDMREKNSRSDPEIFGLSVCKDGITLNGEKEGCWKNRFSDGNNQLRSEHFEFQIFIS